MKGFETEGPPVGWVVLALTTVLLAGCGILDPLGNEFDDARNRWESAELRSYSYEFFGGCFCAPEFTQWVTVTVEDGSVVDVEPLAGGVPIDALPASAWSTVDELFEVIEDARRRGDSNIEVSFDRELGYPTRIHLFPREMVTDAGIDHRARELHPLDI